MEIAQTAPHTVILDEDEASLYIQATTTVVWAPRGQTPLVRCDPGRAKTNFFGTLNLQTGEQTVTQAERMNQATTNQHLAALLSRYPENPLLLLWDRAIRVQRSGHFLKITRDWRSCISHRPHRS